jgi:hypothetical protein
MVMNTFVKIFFENNAFDINNKLQKLKNMNWSTNYIVNKLKSSY